MGTIAATAASAGPGTWGIVARILFPVLGWLGFTLLGLALLMTLLDWGQLCGAEPEPSRRRWAAGLVAACGLVLGIVGLVGSFVT